MIISTDVGELLDQIQQHFLIKKKKTTMSRKKILHMVKVIYEKTQLTLYLMVKYWKLSKIKPRMDVCFPHCLYFTGSGRQSN